MTSIIYILLRKYENAVEFFMIIHIIREVYAEVILLVKECQ